MEDETEMLHCHKAPASNGVYPTACSAHWLEVVILTEDISGLIQ